MLRAKVSVYAGCANRHYTCRNVYDTNIRSHATRERNRQTESRAHTPQRRPNHRYVWANAGPSHTCVGITLQQKHETVVARRVSDSNKQNIQEFVGRRMHACTHARNGVRGAQTISSWHRHGSTHASMHNCTHVCMYMFMYVRMHACTDACMRA